MKVLYLRRAALEDEVIRFFRFAYLGANDTFQSSSDTDVLPKDFAFEKPNSSIKEAVGSLALLSAVARPASAADKPGARCLPISRVLQIDRD